jgi:hypothetical protein
MARGSPIHLAPQRDRVRALAAAVGSHAAVPVACHGDNGLPVVEPHPDGLGRERLVDLLAQCDACGRRAVAHGRRVDCAAEHAR